MFPFCKYFFAKIQEKSYFLWQKTGPWPGNTASIRFYVYQNDIRTDPLDAIPGDHEVLSGAPKTEKAAFSRHHDGADSPLRQLHHRVCDEPQTPTVADADDLLAVQICKSV